MGGRAGERKETECLLSVAVLGDTAGRRNKMTTDPIQDRLLMVPQDPHHTLIISDF